MNWPIPLAVVSLDSREMDQPLLDVDQFRGKTAFGAEVRAKHDYEHNASSLRMGVLEHTGKGGGLDMQESVVSIMPVSSIVHRHNDIRDHFRDG